MTVTTPALGPLDPCYSISRGARMSEVHARHHRHERLTLCGRTIGWDLHPDPARPLGCADCRQTVALIRDRKSRGLPELCLEMTRPRARRGAWTRCVETVEGHRTRPDLDYACPWHTGQDLPPEWDAE